MIFGETPGRYHFSHGPEKSYIAMKQYIKVSCKSKQGLQHVVTIFILLQNLMSFSECEEENYLKKFKENEEGKEKKS